MREKEGTSFGVVSIINHWGVAILFLTALVIGFIMEFIGSGRGVRGPWLGAHQAAGILVLAWSIWRLSWRFVQGIPKDPEKPPLMLRSVAWLVRWVLMLATISMPATGILMSLYGERSVNFFGFFVIYPLPENLLISDIAYFVHNRLAYVVSGVILLHFMAAMKHHFIDRDQTLKRMLVVTK